MKARILIAFAAMLVFLGACTATPVEVTRVVETIKEIEVPGEVETVIEEVIKEVEVPGETVVEEVEVVVTQVITQVVEAEPEAVDRTGAWLDQIIFLEEPNQDAGVARLAAGDIDMYADDIGGAAAVQAIADAGNITAVTQYGLYDEIFFNNGTCADENVLNPFNNAKIREAMNYAIDRDFVADELYGGLAVPKYTTIPEAGADRGKFAPEIRAIEAKYAYNFDTANEIITAEMEGLGAELVDGSWTFAGEPISLVFLIRIEDTRLEIGNYVANQLEEMGFTIERVERTSGELSPIWFGSDPAECQWNLYTGAWSQTAISRDAGGNFDFFYTPRGANWLPWQVYEPTEEFDALSLRLNNNDFTNVEERAELFREILPLAGEMSTRVWVTSRTTLVPFSDQASVSTDLAAGISGAGVWAKTARFKDQVGGSMTIALPSVFTEPFNPVGGSNWVFDNMVMRALGEAGTYADPNTGLAIPNRIERAELVVQEGFPVGKTLDWIDLSFESEIVVPDDAWVDWDAENQVFITAADGYTETTTAVFKSTVYYPEDMFDTMTWHDGSPLTVADFVMAMIIQFDLAKPESPYYEEALVPTLDQFLSAFKGTRVVSTDPLVIEYYGDNASLDAENSVVTWYPNATTYGFADAAWHNMAAFLRTTGNEDLAFTEDEADANEVERLNMIAGPSLELIATEVASSTAEAYIPYAATLGDFITADEATARYENLAEFARRYGHYYLGTNVYYLSGVFPVEGQAILKRYEAHPDPANRWDRFSAPAIAEVEVDGDSRVTIGDEASFEIFVDAFGEAYAVDDIEGVTYLLFDATGAQVSTGTAEAVEDGVWEIVLDGDTTGELSEGSNRLEVVVVSKLVALPSLGDFQFVTAP